MNLAESGKMNSHGFQFNYLVLRKQRFHEPKRRMPGDSYGNPPGLNFIIDYSLPAFFATMKYSFRFEILTEFAIVNPAS